MSAVHDGAGGVQGPGGAGAAPDSAVTQGANGGVTTPGDVLLVDGLRVAYNGAPALDGVTLAVPHGAQVAVVGPNGAGKSTLFKAIVGLLRPQKGRVLIHGRPPGDQTDPVAYVPQREEVDWRFPVSVADVVMMGRYGRLGPLKRPQPADREAVERALEQLGITDLAGRPIGELSGGQQQRVFLARALAQEPHVLLLDEPFTGVDVRAREAVLELLDGLRAAGITVLASTHDMETASQRFELVALLNGRLIAYGAPAAVFTPDHLAAAFGGQALILDGMVVIDQCCPGHVGDGVEHRHEHGHQTELWHERGDGLRLWHERGEERGPGHGDGREQP